MDKPSGAAPAVVDGAMRFISYGGGVQSTALLVLAARGEIDYRVALFANTGDDSEHPATIRYVRDIAEPFARQWGIELVELDRWTRNGEIETLLGRLERRNSSIGIPVRMNGSGAPGNRNCTIDFKIKVIAKELKRRGATAAAPATVALGISVDEFQRMRSTSGIPHELLDYPLIERRLDRAACVAIIERAGLPVPPKSSCWFCPFHSTAHWRRMLETEPDLFAKAVALEAMLNARRFALGKDAVWFSGALKPLDEAITDNGQISMFDGATCDIGGHCFA